MSKDKIKRQNGASIDRPTLLHFDPLIDAIEYSRGLIAPTRKLTAGRGIAKRVASE